ncbi:DMT family transporter [Paracoccus sp. (in: a-proteobacteria)]|uniref:DMT family transporter n=1 Tax=Paracoccus sp. TaxID=267 RepID=UPI0035B34EAC
MVTENFRGAILMVASMVLFAFEDMFIKLLTAELHFAEVLTLVGLLGTLGFVVALKLQGGRLLTRDQLLGVVIFRNLAEGIGALGVVAALALSDLSSTAAILQAMPLVIVLGAALFLGEPVGPRRWSAIVIGFLGVVMIVRPGLAGFQPASLLAVLAVLTLGARDIATRRIPGHVQSLQLAASAFLAVFIAGLVMALVMGQGFVLPNLRQWLLLCGAVGVGASGYALLIIATRVAEASALAPYRYSRLVFSLMLAWFVLNERPDALTLVGAAVIVASGCYTMWREAVLRRCQLRRAGFVTTV